MGRLKISANVSEVAAEVTCLVLETLFFLSELTAILSRKMKDVGPGLSLVQICPSLREMVLVLLECCQECGHQSHNCGSSLGSHIRRKQRRHLLAAGISSPSPSKIHIHPT